MTTKRWKAACPDCKNNIDWEQYDGEYRLTTKSKCPNCGTAWRGKA